MHKILKDHNHNNYKKRSKSIGILCKLRHYISSQTLTQLYYALVYPFLTYGCMVWGSTYKPTMNPLVVLQKRTSRILSFVIKFDAHTKSSDCKTQNFQTTRYNISIYCMLYVSIFKIKSAKGV